MRVINAKGLHYKELNEQIKEAVSQNTKITLSNISGHRYIGAGISKKSTIIIEGVPGNDLAAFMNGAELIVNANGQDAIANTMNDGEIIIHGMAGDTLGYGMRGGTIFVRDNVGYRNKIPAIIVGGSTGDFFGEYMAGGILVVLGLNAEEGKSIVGNYCGTGMHGGVMYIRGHVEDHQLGREVKSIEMEESDYIKLE